MHLKTPAYEVPIIIFPGLFICLFRFCLLVLPLIKVLMKLFLNIKVLKQSC